MVMTAADKSPLPQSGLRIVVELFQVVEDGGVA